MIPERLFPVFPDRGERTEETPEPAPDILTAITTALVLCRGNTHTVCHSTKTDEGINTS